MKNLKIPAVPAGIQNPFPETISHSGGTHVNVVVHTGYFTDLSQKDIDNLTLQYGPYLTYFEDLEGTLPRLETEGNPLVYFVEGEVLKEEGRYGLRSPQNAAVPESAILFLTLPQDTKLPRIFAQNGFLEQKIDLLWDFMRTNGLSEARFAGEVSWHYDARGCVSVLASAFEGEGFSVKGLEGALYPTIPPPRDLALKRPILQQLYEEQVMA